MPLEKINEAVEFIHWNMQAGRSVYVDCKAGRSRSALVQLCYLMEYHQMSAEVALQTLQEHRSQVSIETDKWATAKEYERLLLARAPNR